MINDKWLIQFQSEFSFNQRKSKIFGWQYEWVHQIYFTNKYLAKNEKKHCVFLSIDGFEFARRKCLFIDEFQFQKKTKKHIFIVFFFRIKLISSLAWSLAVLWIYSNSKTDKSSITCFYLMKFLRYSHIWYSDRNYLSFNFQEQKNTDFHWLKT